MKRLQYRQNLSLLFACLSLLILGGCALYRNGGINYTSLVASFSQIIPGVLVMYGLGWLIGMMIEGSKTVKKEKDIGYTNALLEEILREEGLDNIDELDNTDMPETNDNNGSIDITNIEPESKE